MKQRIIGAFFVVIVTLITFLSPSIVTAVCLTAISFAALYEFLKVYNLQKSPFLVINFFGTVAVYVLLFLNKGRYLLPLLIILSIISLSIYVILFPRYKDKDISVSIFSFIYIPLMLSYVFQLHELEAGILYCFFILISSWGNDVFAYLTGSAIGKHKCTPKVSPNKSVEGFIGGIIGAGLLGYVFAVIFKEYIPINGLYCAIIAALGAIPGDIGDLAASAIKRDNDIKDYSKLIPGHGGMVDRIDSVLFTAPIIYYLVILFNIV